ncbi:MAG: type II toxin-antitoxin system YafQ family toxin [Sulfurimonas sp.]|uniref:type II toxin-antitoxin system RelE/ParE family toxin n=1 Tax=Sulfurimonas sp. TaxID=2022749 RepID=UPI002607DC05|nr:type II toxin-antitoxin system YafQ family toxin [Sulfurimonas sp.]MDD5371986.1 type II toxin-antitoxin system YafQ family toxin [Sulfurimonas sp.]
MRYKISITDDFNKKVIKFLKKHPNLYSKFTKSMSLLADNPFHPSLRLHKLQGQLSEYHSVSIDLSYRMVIEFIIKENEIIPIDIGTHDEVY